MHVSLMYILWKILLSNMSRPETFGMTLLHDISGMCRITVITMIIIMLPHK